MNLYPDPDNPELNDCKNEIWNDHGKSNWLQGIKSETRKYWQHYSRETKLLLARDAEIKTGKIMCETL